MSKVDFKNVLELAKDQLENNPSIKKEIFYFSLF